MLLSERIENEIKEEIAKAGRSLADPKMLVAWMRKNEVGRSAMSAATGANYADVQAKERASVRNITAEEYARLSKPLTPENYPGKPSSWDTYKPRRKIIEALSKVIDQDARDMHWIVALYIEHANRLPDAEGFALWLDLLAKGHSEETVRKWIVNGFEK